MITLGSERVKQWDTGKERDGGGGSEIIATDTVWACNGEQNLVAPPVWRCCLSKVQSQLCATARASWLQELPIVVAVLGPAVIAFQLSSLAFLMTDWEVTLSLPRVVNFKFPLHLTRNITSHSMENLACLKQGRPFKCSSFLPLRSHNFR